MWRGVSPTDFGDVVLPIHSSLSGGTPDPQNTQLMSRACGKTRRAFRRGARFDAAGGRENVFAPVPLAVFDADVRLLREVLEP
jgi:hypothetical protein